MSDAATEFSCSACGKSYKLKPELSGKRVKCKCGQVITAPKYEPPEDDQGMYDFKDETPTAAKGSRSGAANPQVAAPVARPASAVAYAGAKSANSLQYESKGTKKDRFAADNLIDQKRDIYFPVGVFIAGMIGLLVWAVVSAHADSTGIALFSIFILLKTAVKVIVLTGLAMIVAPAAGLSFGTFWHAILKFAAIIVFADMVLMWTETWIDSLGGTRRLGMRSNMYIGAFKTMLLGAFIAIQLRLLFDMDSEETGMIAIPMAIVNRIMEFIAWILLVGVVEGIAAAAAPGPAPAPAVVPATNMPATFPAASTPNAAPAETLSASDRSIKEQIKGAVEGYEWDARYHSDKHHGVVYDAINVFAPKRLYFKPVGKNLVAVLIELPDSKETRASLISAANQMIARYSPDKTEISDDGQKYIKFLIPDRIKKP